LDVVKNPPPFSDAAAEAAFWKSLVKDFQKEARRASESDLDQRVENLRLKTELYDLKNEIKRIRAEVSASSTKKDYDAASDQGLLGVFSAGGLKRSSSLERLRERVTGGTKMDFAGFTSSEDTPSEKVLGSIPKLSSFDGKDSSNYPYRRWIFDVKQLLKAGYSEKIVRMSVLRSCKGTAADILQTLGDDFTVEDVATAFDRRFASVATVESMLSTFYSAKQKADESVNSWGCRLESWLASPQLSSLAQDQKHSMLRERFWRGLKSDLMRNALRHRFDLGAKYEDLLVVAREVEMEGKSNQKDPKDKAKVATQSVNSKGMQGKLDDILKRLTVLESRLPATPATPASTKSTGRGRGRGKGRGRVSSGRDRDSQTVELASDKKQEQVKTTFVSSKCFKCGKTGHFKSNCPLN
jgi:hypothetical protein